MFFILSKVLLFLLSPAFWIIVLLLWSFYTKKEIRKRRLRIVSLVLFIVFTNPFIFNVLVRKWQPEQTALPAGRTYAAGILLGGITMTDKNHNLYFGPDADRFIQATRLYHSGVIKNILVTGASPSIVNTKRIPEASQLKQQLILQGIPETNILIEDKARNTFENATFTRQILDSLKLAPPYILITSALHVPRAVAVFRKAGLDVIACPSAFKEINRKVTLSDFIPSTDLLSVWPVFLKEVVGLTVYRTTGKA